MIKDNTLAWRLKKAMHVRGKGAKEICGQVGITTAALSQYVTGTREPSTKVLVALASSLDVSTDYLLGLSPTMQVATEEAGIAKKYGLRDSTLQLFKALHTQEHTSVECETELMPKDTKYNDFVDDNTWTYVRNMQPAPDIQSFLLDFFDNKKIYRMMDAICLYQIAASYVRQFHDRHAVYEDDLTDSEREYVLNLHFQGTETEDTRFIAGIPLVFGEKAEKYRMMIKRLAAEIIDDCCDNYEICHDQFFREAKKEFAMHIKDAAFLHSEVEEILESEDSLQ